jgi:hypothetical protein
MSIAASIETGILVRRWLERNRNRRGHRVATFSAELMGLDGKALIFMGQDGRVEFAQRSPTGTENINDFK